MKSSEKASCICNMVVFNKAPAGIVAPLRLPSVEFVGFLQILQWNNHLDFLQLSCSDVVAHEVILRDGVEWPSFEPSRGRGDIKP